MGKSLEPGGGGSFSGAFAVCGGCERGGPLGDACGAHRAPLRFASGLTRPEPFGSGHRVVRSPWEDTPRTVVPVPPAHGLSGMWYEAGPRLGLARDGMAPAALALGRGLSIGVHVTGSEGRRTDVRRGSNCAGWVEEEARRDTGVSLTSMRNRQSFSGSRPWRGNRGSGMTARARSKR